MGVNQLKSGAFLSYIQMFLNVIMGVFYTPFVLQCLGKSEYGLYSTVSSTIAMLSILNLGFNGSYVRFFTKYKVKDDVDSINKLNGLYLLVFLGLAVIAFICGMFLTFNLKYVFDNGLTDSEYKIAQVLMLLLTVNLTVSFIMNVFTGIISAYERYFFLKTVAIVKSVMVHVVTVPFLLLGYRSITMVIVSVVISLITDFVYVCYVFGILKTKVWFGHIEKGIFKSLVVYTSFIAINLLVDQININVDKILLGRYCGTAEVAVYTVGFTLYSYYQMISLAISGVFSPKIHRIVNVETNKRMLAEKLTGLFVKVGRIQFVILSLVATGIMFFGKSFINIWAGNGYEVSYYVSLMLVLSATIPLIQNLGIEIQRALNIHKFRSVLYLFMAFINLGLSIYLCQLYGAIGSTIGTAISFLLVNGLVMNIYYHKKCHINICTFWKNILLLARALIVPVCFGYLLNKLFCLTTIIEIIVGILLYCVVFAFSMWLFGFDKDEKELFIKPVKKLVRKHDKNC